MKKYFNFVYLCFIPIGIFLGIISCEYHNSINRINRTPSMDGAFSFYAFTFLGFYSALILTIYSCLVKSKINRVIKIITIIIIAIISIPILGITYLSL